VPQPVRRTIANRIRTDLVEADVDMGFALVDQARSYLASGRLEVSVQLLQEIAKVLADIEQRLAQLGDSESGPFQLLVAELRNELAAVEREIS
jgi:hypothetical protein